MSTRSPVGAACPYCHFPIKSGVEVTSCDACGSPHHVECWAENEGCAVTGCARYAGPPGSGPTPSAGAAPGAPAPASGAEDTAETATLPAGGQAPRRPRAPTPPARAASAGPRAPQDAPQAGSSRAWGQPPPPSSSGPSGDGSRGKWIALGALIPLVVVLAVVVGYLLASPGGDDKGGKGDDTARVTTTDGSGGSGKQDGTTTGPAPGTTGPAPATTGGTPGGGSTGAAPPAAPSAADQKAARQQQVAQQLVALMAQSARGRKMTVGHQYAAALANRRAVARKLGALEPADGAQRSAIASFRAAMSASESAIGAHSADPTIGLTPSDTEASRQKTIYCQKWSSSGMAASTGQVCDPNGI